MVSKKVPVSVPDKFGTSTGEFTGIFHFWGCSGTGTIKFWYRNNYRNWYRKNLLFSGQSEKSRLVRDRNKHCYESQTVLQCSVCRENKLHHIINWAMCLGEEGGDYTMHYNEGFEKSCPSCKVTLGVTDPKKDAHAPPNIPNH